MLRDEAINKAIDEIYRLTGEDFHGYRSEIWCVIAEAMRFERDSPGGLVAVSGCNHSAMAKWNAKHCPDCHGTGRIVRDLSVAEALEWAKSFLYNYENLSIVNSAYGKKNITMPNGERIMRKEDLP